MVSHLAQAIVDFFLLLSQRHKMADQAPPSLKTEAPSLQKSARNGAIRYTTNVLRTLGFLVDVFALLSAYLFTYAAHALFPGFWVSARLHTTFAIVVGLTFLLIRISRDAYAGFVGGSEEEGATGNMEFLFALALGLLLTFQFDRGASLEVSIVGGFALSAVIFLFGGRVALRILTSRLISKGAIRQNVIVYAQDMATYASVVAALEKELLPHVRVVGFADDRTNRVDTNKSAGVPYIGGLENLVEYAQAGLVDQVILALPRITQSRLDHVLTELSAAAVDVCILPREFSELRTSRSVSFLGSMPVINVWQQPIRDFDGIGKMLIDKGLTVLGLIILSPIMLLTVIAIRLESPGPILFTQRRFGFNNLEISVLKFRSMYVDLQDVSGAQRTSRDDNRVTMVGRFIRRFSIDELPQLLNVLRGEMSLVGPRPHATQMRVGDKYYFDAVADYTARHRVRPGITGLAQVRGLRGEISTIERAKKRVEYDVYYIEHWSPLLDIRIIVETAFKVIWDRNAY
jgi:polysaccharide biosynthesis protein PslA